MNQRQREISLTFTTRCPHVCMLWQCLVVLPSLCSWSSVSCDELDRGLKHKGACAISWWSVHLNNNRGRIVSVQEAHCCYGGEERGAWDLEYFLLWSGMQGRHCVSFFWSVTAHEVMMVKTDSCAHHDNVVWCRKRQFKSQKNHTMSFSFSE